MNQDYKNQKLTYQDGLLLDENGHAVMMEWEREIMRRQAKTITQRGGRVLNVGFGMGIIDSYIQEADNVSEHWIIEGHPDVQQYMIENGWLEKANCIFKPWQDVVRHLPKFDGIYIDTWSEDLTPFYIQAQWILKPDGVFSFFNNPRGDEEGLHMDPREWAAVKTWGTVEFEEFEIPYISPNDTQRTDGAYYWSEEQRIYYNPSVRHDPARQNDEWRVQARKHMRENYGLDLQGKPLTDVGNN